MQWKTGPKTKLVVGPETKLSINLPELSYHAARPVPPNRWPILDPYCFLFWFWTSGTREAGTGELAERTAMLQHGSLPCSPMSCGGCGCRVNLPATDSAPLQLGAVRGQDGAFDAAVLGRRGGCGALLAVSVPADTSCVQLNRPPAPPASLSSPHSSQPSLTPPRVFHFLVNT